MKEDIYNDPFEDKKESVDLQAIFTRYLIRWPWFLFSVLLCMVGAWLYLHYTAPVYNVTASVVIKENKNGDYSGADVTFLKDFSFYDPFNNVDNEIEILQSKSLVQDVVEELKLYVDYTTQDRFKGVSLYDESPIEVDFSPQAAAGLASPCEMTLCVYPENRLDMTLRFNDQVIEQRFDSLPATFQCKAGTFVFTGNTEMQILEETSIEVTISQPSVVAKKYVKALSAGLVNTNTSVVQLSLKDTNRKRGEDFINKLVEMYNRLTNDAKNEIAEKTARFIDERIAVINKELSSTEEELEYFKRASGLTNLSSDTQRAVNDQAESEKKVIENGTQLQLINHLSKYMNASENLYDMVPLNLGASNQSLTDIIIDYNKKIQERNHLLRSSSEENPVIRRLESQIQEMRANLITSIASVRTTLIIQRADLEREKRKYVERISDMPSQERQFVNIQRLQEIKSELFLIMLEKREENNIALAVTANKARIIDAAFADVVPVFPKNKLVYLIALILGLVVPVVIIYLIYTFRFRIVEHADVEKITTVPIVGNIPLSHPKTPVVVRKDSTGVMMEAFRDLRTSLLYLLDTPDRKVVLVTSTINAEGKTFVAFNLAASLALLNKRVIVVGLDFRNPGLAQMFDSSHQETGMVQYLAHPQLTALYSFIQPSGIIEGLDLLPEGGTPAHSSELLAGQAFANVIDHLRNEYDYIVLDTSPIAAVADTKIIAHFADVSIYVCRSAYTRKTDFQLINELQTQRRFSNLCTVINGTDIKQCKYRKYHKNGK